MIPGRKQTFIILFAVAVVVIAGIVFYIGLNTSGNNITKGIGNVSDIEVRIVYEGTVQVPEIAMETTLPKVSGKIMVYKANRELSEEEIVKIAEAFGITGEPIKDLGMMFIEKEPFSISAEPSGGMITYSNDTTVPGYNNEYLEKYLPTDEDARIIADYFLDSNNLRPRGAKYSHVNHDIGYFGDISKKQKVSESINVWYIHEIDGSLIFTDKMYVQVGVHGLVNRMFRKWTESEPYREHPIITPEQAVEHLKKTGIVMLGNVKDPQKATVTSVTIGYIGETQTKTLPYLLPVYQFEGVVRGADGTEAAFWQWIPATPELAAEIT